MTPNKIQPQEFSKGGDMGGASYESVWAVNANWNADNDGWNVNANKVDNPNGWNADNQVLSRNCYISPPTLHRRSFH